MLDVKDYRYYLRMWAKEKEPKKETIKDLPRMNQVSLRAYRWLRAPITDQLICVTFSV